MELIAEIIVKDGLTKGHVLPIPIEQLVLRRADGTPVLIAAKYGPGDAYIVSKHGEPDFNRFLQEFGVGKTVIVDKLGAAPPPAGARLIVSP